ncbi:hypothetical protein BH24GEM1_BH24GEM1_15240 [soil metagenome]
MQELINQVAQRTGLGPDKARTAVETVLEFAKSRLPAPIATQLQSALGGGAGGTDDLTSAVKGMGGFGTK